MNIIFYLLKIYYRVGWGLLQVFFYTIEEVIMKKAILLFGSIDKPGIIARIASFIASNYGNIVQADQHSTESGSFFIRVEFSYDSSKVTIDDLFSSFQEVATGLNGDFQMHDYENKKRMGILVSKFDHCLVDILYRWKKRELLVDIPFVISNHEDLKELVESYGIPFYYFPVTKETRLEQEMKILELAKEDTDFLVLARYMQILSDDLLKQYNRDIINIHHSFLPSFKGADPYRQAYNRGVKIIGATAHFVSADLDEGPIIEQIVNRVSHRDSVESLKRIGWRLEQDALSMAIKKEIESRIIRHKNKTIVFN